jgi:uncharacterized caspase-like protein
MLRAVLVGIDAYRDPFIPRLSHARTDATALARLLEQRIQPEERSVRLLVDEEATKRNIEVAINEELHRAVEPGDVVLLYFACHGSPERRAAKDRRSRHLIAHDTEYGRIYATGIDMERDLSEWFERLAEAKLIVIFLDACFSGAAGGRTFMGPVLKANPKIDGTLSEPQLISLKALDLGRGRVLLCACDDDQLAREDPALGHGIFTHHLLQGLLRDRGAARTVDLVELYQEVADGVSSSTNNKQQPVITVLKGWRPRLPYLG